MRLSKRIHKLAELVPQGSTAADIGTDHGYVPMLLIESGASPRVIMSDISDGSLAKAKETFRICGLYNDPADFRTGDGLSVIETGEVDVVIIAGLGGHTIVDILDADIAKSKSFDTLILQPRKHSGTLRYYLYTHGWDIASEHLEEEGKFQCEILIAEPEHVESREGKYPADDIRWKYPEEAALSNPDLAAKRIEWKISSIDKQIYNLKAGSSDNKTKILRLQADNNYLKGLLKMTGDKSTSM